MKAERRVALVADAGSIHTARWWSALSQAGLRVRLFSDRLPPPDLYPRPPEFSRLPLAKAGRANLPQVVARLRTELRRFGPHLVHAHYVSRYGWYAALAGVHPLVLSVWGADVEVFPTRFPALTVRILRWTLARADVVTATSRYLAEVTSRYVDGSAVRVVPFGVDLARFRPMPWPAHNGLRVVVNKALEPAYGIDRLLVALGRLKAGATPGLWRVRILGAGSQLATLQALSRRLGLQAVVEWPGRVAPAELPVALGWGDIGVYPSRRESFGVATLEMQAVGRPVLAARVGGLPEVVRPGGTGWLFAPEPPDQLAALLAWAQRHPSALRVMGNRAAGWVAEHYAFTTHVQAMLDIYDSLWAVPGGAGKPAASGGPGGHGTGT